jgi:hypothetical protein
MIGMHVAQICSFNQSYEFWSLKEIILLAERQFLICINNRGDILVRGS